MNDDFMNYSLERNHNNVPPRKIGDIFMYEVKPGDNVYQIARRFQTRVEYIGCMNNLDIQMKIYPGQRLVVPVLYQMPREEESRSSYELYF